MDYGNMVGFVCVKMLYEKNNLLEQIDNLNHQIENLGKYDEDLLTDEMCMTLFNQEKKYITQKRVIQSRIDEIDYEFNIIIKGLLLSFSKTNILEKDLTDKLIYDTI